MRAVVIFLFFDCIFPVLNCNRELGNTGKSGTSNMSASNLLDNLLNTTDDSEAKTEGMGLNIMSAECDRGDLNPFCAFVR